MGREWRGQTSMGSMRVFNEQRGGRKGVGPGPGSGERGGVDVANQLVTSDSATLRAVFGGVACPPRLAEAYVVTEK